MAVRFMRAASDIQQRLVVRMPVSDFRWSVNSLYICRIISKYGRKMCYCRRLLKGVVAAVLVSLVSLFFCGTAVAAGDRQDDFAVWSSITVRKHIVSGLSLSLNGELRTARTATDINLWWVNPELRFRFNELFSLEAGYRYARVNRIDYWEPAHRWYAGGTIGISIGPVYFYLRELIEQIYYTDRDPNASGSVISYLRSRLRVELKMDALPITPFIGVENFLYLFDYRKGETGIMRYTAGVRVPVGKMHSFSGYYRFQQTFSSSGLDEHILGLGYTLSF